MAEVRSERVVYTGHVQGVGFRYTVRSLARRHPVAGYVKNLPDGSVELVAQGTPPAIDAFLVEVAGQFSANIRHCAREQIPYDEQLSGFEIRF